MTHTPLAAVATRVEIDFPIKYFDIERPTMWISPQGFIQFTNDTTWYWTNATMPSSNAPNGIIAPFFDDLDIRGSGAHLKTQILGTAPNRTLVVEWRVGFYLQGTNFANFQVWFMEGSSTIEFHYGTIAPDGFHASMGIEDDTGTVGYEVPTGPNGSSCNPNCNDSTWLTDTVVTFSQGPELRTAMVEGPVEAFAGLSVDLAATVTNVGGKPAEDFTLRFYVSENPHIDSTAIELVTLEQDVRSLNPQQDTTFTASPRLPITLEEGSWYIIAEADPHEAVPETNRGDNFATFGPFKIGVRAANLEVPWVDAKDLVHPGQEINVRWLARNTGNLMANAIDYRVGLERSQFPTTSSPSIGSGTIDWIEMGHERLVDTAVTIPADAEPGLYYISVEINPYREVFEHERRDNFGVSLPVVVSEEELAVVTESLPTAHIHGHYEYRLVAAGGSGVHHWSVKEGTVLPPGLRLEARESELGAYATFLTGQPSAVGEFPLSFVVLSGEFQTEVEYELFISSAEHALTVATESLAEASFGFAYRHELSAMGGKPPYSWEVAREDALPHGVFLRSDGVLSGRPMQDGSFTIPVRVSDSEGRQTTKEFELNVSPPATLTCVTQELPVLEIDEFVQLPLIAAGGKKRVDGTYLWTEHSLIRLAQELGESSGPVVQDLGLQLDPDGRVHGIPKLFGTFLWTVQVMDDSPGTQGLRCPILVRIPRDRGLTVVTKQLPAGIAGRSYRAQLDASGGDGDLTWTEFGSGRLLDELKLSFDATGNLAGTPSIDALQGEEEREFSLTVRVEDAKGRIGIGVVSLTLKDGATKSKAGTKETAGCQTGAGAPAAWMLALLGLALLRRRR